MNDIIETTQMVVSIHNHSIDEWVKGYNDLIKHQDAQQGYYFMVAKKALNLTFDEFAYSIGISVQTAVKKIKLYKDLKELGVVAPEKELPKSAQQNSVLKGTTPEEKADNYQLVKECTKNNTPTTKQIKEVMKSIEQPADIVKPSIKKSLRNDIRISNLKPVLNEELYEKEVEAHKVTKEKLKKERELKDKYYKELKEKVDMTPLRAARKELEEFWERLVNVSTNYRQKLRNERGPKRGMTMSMIPRDAFRILGLTPNSSLDEVKRAYKTLAKKLHPDMPNGNEEVFKELSENYKLIKEALKGK